MDLWLTDHVLVADCPVLDWREGWVDVAGDLRAGFGDADPDTPFARVAPGGGGAVVMWT